MNSQHQSFSRPPQAAIPARPSGFALAQSVACVRIAGGAAGCAADTRAGVWWWGGFQRGIAWTGTSRAGIAWAMCCLLLLCSAGCSTYANRLANTQRDFQAGKLAAAMAAVDANIESHPNDANVLKLDRAMLALAAGRPAEAERTLREVRTQFDHLEQASLVEEGVDMFTDGTRRAYAGENYEKILIRAMLALSNLMHDGGDAEAYALQISAKQREIQQAAEAAAGDSKPPVQTQVAFGAYVQAAVREESPSRYDEVAAARAQVVSFMPGYSAGAADLQRAQTAAHSARGNGVLYVFALTGRGPHKVEAYEPVSSASLLIADRILSAVGDQELPPTIAPVKIPRVVATLSVIDRVGVAVDGKKLGVTETIADINQLAVEQHELALPSILARAVVRRIVKKTAVYSAKTAVAADQNALADLALTVAGIAWEASESADTRCWGLLPGRIQVLRIELPAGQHTIELEPLAPGLAVEKANATVEIRNGHNTYLLGNFPETRLVGELTVR